MSNDRLDLAGSLEVLEALAGQGAVDLQSVDEGGNGDETVRADILGELVGGALVEKDGVLGLVLDCEGGLELAIVALGAAAAEARTW